MIKKALKIKSIVSVLLFIFIFISVANIGVLAQTGSSQRTNGTVFTDQKMTVTQSDYQKGLWDNSQWKFYKVVLPLGEGVKINMTYTGTLDLDLRLYVDQKDYLQQDNLAWDITHCGIKSNIAPTENSQIRGDNATENVQYTNVIFPNARNVYVLVFVYSGVGNSTYTINSNVTMSAVSSTQLSECYGVNQLWTILFIAMAGILALFIFIGVRSVRKPSKEDKVEKAKKTGKIKNKKVKQQKVKTVKKKQKPQKVKKAKKVSMKKRGSSNRR